MTHDVLEALLLACTQLIDALDARDADAIEVSVLALARGLDGLLLRDMSRARPVLYQRGVKERGSVAVTPNQINLRPNGARQKIDDRSERNRQHVRRIQNKSPKIAV